MDFQPHTIIEPFRIKSVEPIASTTTAQRRAALEALCETPVQTAGVPFGAYSAQVLRRLAATGYACAYTSDGGTMQPNAFLRPRSSVRRDMALEDVIGILKGRMGFKARVRRSLGMMRKQFF